MPAPQYVKEQADDARKLMTRPPEAAPEPEPDPEPKKERIDPTDYKSRFSLLLNSRDDRYEKSQAEVQRLQAENAALEQRLAELQPAQESPAFQISEDDRENLGEIGASVVENVTRHVDSRFKQMDEEKQAERQKQHERFLRKVDSRVPEWRKLNSDATFLAWLEGVDEQFKVSHQTLLDRGIENQDVELIGSVFDQFYSQRDGNQSNSSHDASPEPDVRATEATGDTYEEWWEAKEIADHYTQKTRMARQRRNSGPEWDKVMERQLRIDDAIRNNRILR